MYYNLQTNSLHQLIQYLKYTFLIVQYHQGQMFCKNSIFILPNAQTLTFSIHPITINNYTKLNEYHTTSIEGRTRHFYREAISTISPLILMKRCVLTIYVHMINILYLSANITLYICVISCRLNRQSIQRISYNCISDCDIHKPCVPEGNNPWDVFVSSMNSI